MNNLLTARIYSVSREFGSAQQAADLLLRKSFSFDLRQIRRDM